MTVAVASLVMWPSKSACGVSQLGAGLGLGNELGLGDGCGDGDGLELGEGDGLAAALSASPESPGAPLAPTAGAQKTAVSISTMPMISAAHTAPHRIRLNPAMGALLV